MESSLITYFLILIPFISVQGQETYSLETQQEPFTSVDFKIGSLSHATVNIECKINMNVAILSNFVLVTYIHLFLLMVILHARACMHFSYTRLGGYKQYGLRDSTLK